KKVKTPAPRHFLIEPLLPAEGFRERVRGRPCERGDRKESHAEDSESKKSRCELARERPQGFRGLTGRFDLRNAVPMQRDSRRENDEEHYEIREERAHPHVQLSVDDFSLCRATSAGARCLSELLLFLDLL